MTKKEFDNTEFKKGMRMKFRNCECDIMSVDFQDGEIGIEDHGGSLIWLPYSKCELIK